MSTSFRSEASELSAGDSRSENCGTLEQAHDGLRCRAKFRRIQLRLCTRDCALYVCDVLGVEVSKHDRDFLVRRCNGPYFDVQTHGGLVVLFSEQDSDEVFGFLAGKALIRIGDDGKAIQ